MAGRLGTPGANRAWGAGTHKFLWVGTAPARGASDVGPTLVGAAATGPRGAQGGLEVAWGLAP